MRETSKLAKEDQEKQAKNHRTNGGRLTDMSMKFRTSASSDPCVTLEYPAGCETQSRPGSVLVQNSCRVDDDVRIFELDAFYGKDGRRSRYIGAVLERYRGEDAGDLKRSELFEKWTCLNVLEKEIRKLDQKILAVEKSWRTWNSNQEHRYG